MLPFEVFMLPALVASSVASGQPVENNLSMELPLKQDWSQVSLSDHKSAGMPHDRYRCFGGKLENYPNPEDWISWDALWDNNREQVLSSNGGNTYIQHYIMDSILKVAGESHVDARLILALVMQESKGNAAVACTEYGSRCGMMHARKGRSFDASNPEHSILTAIREGIGGQSRSGPGYAILLNGKPKVANLPLGIYFAAARMYNSGTVPENLDEVSTGQASYANDLANRLIGWDGRGKGFKTCK